MAEPSKYMVRGFDAGDEEENPDEYFDSYNDATDRYDSIHFDVKQFFEWEEKTLSYQLTNQHVYGRMSFNINQ